MIERVSDDDLNSLDEVVAGISKYIEPAVGAQIIADIRAELLALRKVADAAEALVSVRGRGELPTLEAALLEAGR